MKTQSTIQSTLITTGITELNTYVNTGDFIELLTNSYTYTSSSISSLYHYVAPIDLEQKPIESIEIDEIDREILRNFPPLFFKDTNIIKVPAKTVRALREHVSHLALYTIHQDLDTAIELCLIFLSNLTGTYFKMKDTNDSYYKQGWKNLLSTELDKQLGDENKTDRIRQAIVNVLTTGTVKQGAIIECDNKYMPGVYSKGYRLGPSYLAKGVITYELKTKVAQKLRKGHYLKQISKLIENPIGRNLLQAYYLIELPTKEKIEQEAKRLIKEKYTKKGYQLIFKGKKSKESFGDRKVKFVEDAIEVFDYLTNVNFLVPTIGGENSGGRIVDSFTLMPSWIRKMCKMNGKTICDSDYSALHPNIAMSLYGGKKQYVSHQEVADYLKMDLVDIKTEHLSFFNKTEYQMKQSILWNYYQEFEPEMMKNILKEKRENDKGHKITSSRMFKKEVEIMKEVVMELNKRCIFVGYVYDALFCEQKHKEEVKQVMNEIILNHGVFTSVK